MIRHIGVFLQTIVIALAVPVFAHQAHTHVMGTVAALDANHIVVKNAEGITTSIALTDETKYRRGKTATSRADLKIGDRVVVEATKRGDRMIASEVRFSSEAGKKAP
jgi:Domain of unknown function (DUF5666)